MSRDYKIGLRLTQDMKQRFESIAEHMGMSVSGLAAYVIGDYVTKFEERQAMQKKMMDSSVETITKMADDRFKTEDMSKIFSMFAEQLMSQPKNEKEDTQ